MRKAQSKTKTKKAGPSFWKQQIENWKTSGLSQAQFCLDHNLVKTTFGYWRSKFNRENKPHSLLPVTITPDTDTKSAPGASGISICVKGRFIVQLEERFCGSTLSKLIDILEAR